MLQPSNSSAHEALGGIGGVNRAIAAACALRSGGVFSRAGSLRPGGKLRRRYAPPACHGDSGFAARMRTAARCGHVARTTAANEAKDNICLEVLLLNATGCGPLDRAGSSDRHLRDRVEGNPSLRPHGGWGQHDRHRRCRLRGPALLHDFCCARFVRVLLARLCELLPAADGRGVRHVRRNQLRGERAASTRMPEGSARRQRRSQAGMPFGAGSDGAAARCSL